RASCCIVASCTPCDVSATVSFSGHCVAAMRRRSPTSASSGMSTRKGRISEWVMVSCIMVIFLLVLVRRCGRVVGRAARTTCAPPPSLHLSQRSEARANLFCEEERLFPGRKVPALIDLVVIDEVGVGALGPTPWRLILLAREDRHGRRNRNALDV